MKVESSTKTVVTKCDIIINLNGEREIRALENICQWAENKCYEAFMGKGQLQEELSLIKALFDAIKKPE